MAAGFVHARSGWIGGLIGLLICWGTLRADETNPLRATFLQPVAEPPDIDSPAVAPAPPSFRAHPDSVAPWAKRSPANEADDAGLQPPLESPEPPPVDASPYPFVAPEAHWPDEDMIYEGFTGRGRRRGGIAALRSRMKEWLGLSLEQGARSSGRGIPLTGTSWLNRPWYVGPFIGVKFHDEPLSGVVSQGNSGYVGLRLGRDFDYFWGLEGKFGYTNPDTYRVGTSLSIGESHNYFADVALLYYPWGDSVWRPYVSLGVGTATYRFEVAPTIGVSDSAFYTPLGIGLKYFQSPWFALRFDAGYELSWATGTLDGQSMFSLSVAGELRFGGRRRSYFPWDGGTTLW